jgi:hypothetical protein
MEWGEAVKSAVHRVTQRHGSVRFTRRMLLNEELKQIVSDTGTSRSDPEQGVSFYLQILRDNGYITFFDDDGTYYFLDMQTAVEKEDLPDYVMDGLIKNHQLLFADASVFEGEPLLRHRRGMNRLRQLTMANYGNQCALCDITEDSLLVTSRIVRWADDIHARGDLSNIICLCRFHDVLFETGHFAFTDDLQVVKRPTGSCAMLRHLLDWTFRFRISVDRFRPKQDYVRRHRERVGIVL